MTAQMTTGSTSYRGDGDAAVHENRLVSDNAVEGASLGREISLQHNLNAGAIADQEADPVLGLNADRDASSWRVEVATRLQRYRTRRKPRTPRYPSLLLPFDASESWPRTASTDGCMRVATETAPAQQDSGSAANEESMAGPAAGVARLRLAEADFGKPDFAEPGDKEPGSTLLPVAEKTGGQGPQRYPEQGQEQFAKVIEFPRSAAIPVFRASELADPIFDRPRIVEAPEVLPPPPALGGMLIEPAPQPSVGRRAGPDLSAASASISKRSLAALVDGTILATALAVFGAVFLRMNFGMRFLPNLDLDLSSNFGTNIGLNHIRGVLPTFAIAFCTVAALLWVVYEFLFVVYTGSTPGLRAAGLRLAGFDGSELNRRARRWRVLASVLSAFSAGLGYLWCVLDEDGLCWHDRITHTHVRSAKL
ncbi:MAG: RDD family protein [Terriglobales bacterium]|jgi:uncharacterized RDD family membrane protein YckC